MSMFRRRLLMQNAMRQKHEYLLYSATYDNQSVRITYKQEYFDSVYINEDGVYLGLASGELNYTFAKAGVHEVEVSFKQDITNFRDCFYGCSSLQSIPEGLFRNNTAATNLQYCFQNCENLQSIPEGLFSNNIAATNFQYCFYGCTSLQSIPEGLFRNNIAATNFYYCFGFCASLQSIPEGLFRYNTKVTNFTTCFTSCKNLTGETPKDVDGGELWERAGKEGYPSSITGTLCFRGCTKLDNYEQIPSIWK